MEPKYLLLLASLALSSQTQDVASPVMMMMPVIDKLDVQCSKTGMEVHLTFSAPFSGTVFSKGHFINPNCRYVYQSGGDRFKFTIPADKCGTQSVNKNGKPTLENLIVIQGDVGYQEIWDSSRKLICEFSGEPTGKTVLQRFRVSMLDFEEVRFPGELSDITARMKILEGEWPDVNEIQGEVKIGDEMTVCIEVDNPGGYDTEVRNCFAYDSSDINAVTTNRLRLTDDHGCPVKNKLFGAFELKNSLSTSQKHVHISIMNAFTFPDKMDVFLGCEVEICKGGCLKCSTSDIHTTIIPGPPSPPPDCRPGDLRPVCLTLTVCREGDPVDSRCPCKDNDPRLGCTTTTTTTTTTTLKPCGYFDKVDERCPCSLGDQRPGCTTTSTTTTTTTTTTTPKPCSLDDPVNSRCPCVVGDLRQECTTTSTTTTTTTTTTTPKPCGYFDNVDQRCPCVSGDLRPGCTTTTTTTTTTPKICGYSDPIDERCPCLTNDPRPGCTTTTPTTAAEPTTTVTTKPPCSRNSPVDDRCPCTANDPRAPCTTTFKTSTTRKPNSEQCQENDPRPLCDPNHPFHSRPKPNKPKPNKTLPPWRTTPSYRKKRSLTDEDNIGVTVISRFRVSSKK